MCMIGMLKIRCVLPIAIKFRWIFPHKRWFLRPVDVNAMQIIRGNILFCWPMMSCFGCIISSHLFGLKNNQNESLFSTWINVYLSIPFANMIWSKALFPHNEYTRHMKWICCRFNERIFNSKKKLYHLNHYFIWWSMLKIRTYYKWFASNATYSNNSCRDLSLKSYELSI